MPGMGPLETPWGFLGSRSPHRHPTVTPTSSQITHYPSPHHHPSVTPASPHHHPSTAHPSFHPPLIEWHSILHHNQLNHYPSPHRHPINSPPISPPVTPAAHGHPSGSSPGREGLEVLPDPLLLRVCDGEGGHAPVAHPQHHRPPVRRRLHPLEVGLPHTVSIFPPSTHLPPSSFLPPPAP